jgi:hypothetical protein
VAAELRKVYRQYAAFYAWWTPVVRQEDSKRKRDRRKPKLEHLTELAEERLIAPQPKGDAVEAFRQKLKDLIAKAPVQDRATTFAMKYFVRGLSEVAIGRDEGVSQQWVGKQIRRFVDRDLEPLVPRGGPSALELLNAAGHLRRGRRPRPK